MQLLMQILHVAVGFESLFSSSLLFLFSAMILTCMSRNLFYVVKRVVLLSQCSATICDCSCSHMHQYCKRFVHRLVIADASLSFFTVLSLL